MQNNSPNKVSYKDWNKAISECFYNLHSTNKPVYLQIDHDALTQIGQNLGIESKQIKVSFIFAVQSMLRRNGPQKDQFKNFFRNARTWESLEVPRSPQTSPPFLAFLGLCVLAASEMNADDEVSLTNYYIHLNELLGSGRKRGQPHGFDQIEKLWGKLQWWLDEVLENKFGVPTANNRYAGTHIGYPISQCLLRRTDREKLPDFFNWLGLTPRADTLESNDLIPLLKGWAQKTTCTFSQHGLRVFERGDKELTSQIAELALAEYEVWDGSSTDSVGGYRISEINLQLEFSRRKYECNLYASAPPDFPDGNYQISNQKSLFLQRPFSYANWFNPLDEKLLAGILNLKSLVLRQDKFKLQFRTQSVVPFRNDSDLGLGGWVSCAKIGLGERHVVLCHQSIKSEVELYLQMYAESGWKTISSRQEIFQEKGWICFYPVLIAKQIVGNVHEDLECLIPSLRVGIKLSGGLKVKPGVWLKGGEPEVIISIESNQPTPIYIDEQQVDMVAEKSAIIQLSQRDLPMGQHEIRVGKRRRTFAICDSGSYLMKQSQATLGHLIQRNGNIFTTQSIDPVIVPKELPANHLYINGASIVGTAEDVAFPIEKLLILPYGGQKYIVLGKRPGEVEIYRVANLPLWVAEKRDYLQGHKVTVSFEVQWIVKIKGNNRKVLIAVGSPHPPLNDFYEVGNMELWKQWANKASLWRKLSKKNRFIWEQYNQAAKELQ